MKIRNALVATFLAAAFTSGAAIAHDPALHEPAPAPAAAAKKPKPTTCEQLADTSKYDVNLNDSATKTLKSTCDARRAAPAKN
ncbi:hypothetical protein [Stenotrophomonas sp.]|uniref:hypothetical protein n=1 Tax=Stenotrophomonas sp. TaxID=69392 RepID=UPI0028A9DD32|nr:hypothetical protein [Stenotrophomonas sp.]